MTHSFLTALAAELGRATQYTYIHLQYIQLTCILTLRGLPIALASLGEKKVEQGGPLCRELGCGIMDDGQGILPRPAQVSSNEQTGHPIPVETLKCCADGDVVAHSSGKERRNAEVVENALQSST